MKHPIVVLPDALPAAATLLGQGQATPEEKWGEQHAAETDTRVVPRTTAAYYGTASAVSVGQVLDAAVRLGVDVARFERYASRRCGPGWRRSANGRHQVLDEIERYRNDPEGFADKIDAHLNLSGKPA